MISAKRELYFSIYSAKLDAKNSKIVRGKLSILKKPYKILFILFLYKSRATRKFPFR